MNYTHYEVIRAKQWRNVFTGKTASIYGAVPWTSEAQKAEWTMEENGFTLQNPYTGEVGIGRKPFSTFNEACQAAMKLGRPSRISIAD